MASTPTVTVTAAAAERTQEVEERELGDEGRDAQLVQGLDPRCRIVVVSGSLATGRAFVESVIALSAGETNAAAAPVSESEPVIIPHTLRNRYYTAPVHFAVYTCKGLADALGVSKRVREVGNEDVPLFKSEIENGGLDVGFTRDFEEEEEEEGEGGDEEVKQAPGVVYVWEGREYKELGEIVRGMRRAGWEAEVCLAVRVGGGGGEEEEDVDGGVMEFGFEYVDAGEDKGEVDEDVGRLPRVVDALSTVMWVSMDSLKGKDKEDGIMQELLEDSSMLTPFGRVGGLGRKVSMGFEDEFVPGEYRTPGSVSDFGGSEGYVELEEWDEPTQDEIEETAGRIFGIPKGSEAMDLSEVLASLEAFKGEIAGMESSGEKKKMAARVALGLAYGLDIE